MSKARLVAVCSLILVGALTRLLPHPPNFTPIAAIALFGGAYFSRGMLAYLIPLVAMLVSDLVLGFHSLVPLVYGLFLAIVAIGRLLQDRKKNIWAIGGAALVSSLLFFVVTNFAVWVGGGMYPKTFVGLITCFVAAIPFFHYTLFGDLLYTTVFFGGFALAEKLVPALRVQTLKSMP